MFPSDFFNSVKEQSGFRSERNASAANIRGNHLTSHSPDNFEGFKNEHMKVIPNVKVVIDDCEKEMEEDRELLQLISDSDKNLNKEKEVKNKNNLSTSNLFTSPNMLNLSPNVPNKSKIMYDLKSTGFEMIPEVDEERIKTEYESSKKFFDPRKSSKENFASLNGTNSRNSLNSFNLNNYSFKKSVHIVRESEEENNTTPTKTSIDGLFKERNILSAGEVSEKLTMSSNYKNYLDKNSNLYAIKVKHIRQLSRDKSIESLSTHEYTNDSAKNKRILNANQYNHHINPDKERSNNIFDFSKLNAVNTTSRNELNHIEEISAITPKKLQPVRLMRRQKSEYDISKYNIEENSKNNNYEPTPSLSKTNRITARDRRRSNSKINSGRVSSLPSIRKGKHANNSNEINSIFEEADNYKEDPVIKKKLDNIMQNILDIRNVLSQKANGRFKIASAPTQIGEDANNGLDGNEFCIGVSRVNSTYSVRSKDSSILKGTAAVNLKDNLAAKSGKKAILTNNISRTRLHLAGSHSSNNIKNNNPSYSNYSSNSIHNPNLLDPNYKREKMPIKLIKREKEQNPK